MKSLIVATAVIGSLFGTAAFAQEADEIGEMRSVNLDAVKKPPEVVIGDVLQLVLSSPSAGPEYSVSKVKVKIDGKSLQKVAVVRLPLQKRDGKPVIGATRIAIVVVTKAEGRASVTVTPVSESGKDLEAKKIEIDVKATRPNFKILD